MLPKSAQPPVVALEATGKLTAKAFPNPFNPSTTITYALPEAARVKVRVYNAHGREIATLYDDWQQAGVYSVVFDAAALPSGMYVYVISTEYEQTSGRMMLMK